MFLYVTEIIEAIRESLWDCLGTFGALNGKNVVSRTHMVIICTPDTSHTPEEIDH